MVLMLEVSKPAERSRPYACPGPPSVEGWTELLLGLPEFILTNACLNDDDEPVADLVLPRDVQPFARWG